MMLIQRLLSISVALAIVTAASSARSQGSCDIPPVPNELASGRQTEASRAVVERYRRTLESIAERCGGAQASRQARALLDIAPVLSEIEIQAIGGERGWVFPHRDFRNTRTTAYLVNQPRQGVAAPAGGPPFGVIVVPKGAQVRVTVSSNDIIRSFKVPGLGINTAAIPGRIAVVNIPTGKVGVYRSVCDEDCGKDPQKMNFSVHVVEPGTYQRWYDALEAVTSPLPKR